MNGFLLDIAYDRWVLDALMVIPLTGALLVMLRPAAEAKRLALWVALAEFVVSAGLWWAFDPATAAMQFEVRHEWIPMWNVTYHVGVDGISLFMVLLTTFTMPLAVLGSWSYIKEREAPFYALLLVLTTGMLGVFLALDLFAFYVFWEIMLIPMYFIIGVWGGSRRLYAAIKFFVFTFFGSLLMLVSILVMYYVIGRASGVYSFGYQHMLQNLQSLDPWRFWLFGAFFLAFAIKVPMFPFHTWLPDAHVEAPTAGSVILAGILLKMGTYGFLRFALPFFPTVALHPTVVTVVVLLAVIGIIYGALVALVQPDFKKLVAYSSVSHLGFVMLGIWALTLQSVQGAIIIMISHGISTGALFFLAGMMYERRHTLEIAAFGGIARAIPGFAAVLTLVALSSIGLPGTNGFVGEFLVLIGSFSEFPIATAIATTGVIFAAAYMLVALQRILFGKLDDPANEAMPDLSVREVCVLSPLMICIVWIGLYPAPILRRVEMSAQALITQVRAQVPGQTQAQRPAPDSEKGDDE
ncbi:MAG: NADH-quinone oxidoreductase subunit M [Gemmatimonadetes bacterium]|nr:NADH-quinone oxidoreductase subunit M [Gemmatimonadota bacterium]